ncbi:uncharacterized protein PGTG_21550 [Puccinia graminis f. sp. tritici CRL 75-36-700-3]|uniref:Retrovirus-related Pol polyprotein from transposon TNT 1-94-like beta-barrel domain-containing protein n=1 Tax=Puccinia graminis f. sp. tritici (strain CRL 75-36-700-3 / race SCCL) TaxID=418459 RepID=H6QRS8_PUCGT|nr:uncharacterized protein PGTG_21550 [Puccinia graminis f. sp. tritici CRL 75-36-700-3]EHS63375.1 hypothetical protein PGTG_21550 [Puccinia graminis f. sp. tritici CRL 75-36-700-3]
MTDSATTGHSFKHFTEKLNTENFATWRREMFTALSYLNLDQYILKEKDKITSKTDYDEKAKQTTNLIRMHLDGENFSRFVDDDLEEYKPKELWDSICQHYATKSLENAAKIMEKLTTYDFSVGDTFSTIKDFRSTFQLFIEVTAKKFDKTTVEALWIFWILIKLPTSLALFKTLKFSVFGDSKATFSMSTFLSELERELLRQAEPTATANALAVTKNQVKSNQPKQGNNGQRRKRRVCENGVHNPETSHSAENCHQLHPELAIAYHQAALDRINGAGINPKSGLSVNRAVTDAIVLDSGASGHYLRKKEYFNTFTPIDSAVFGANGASIPIVGVGKAVIHTASGPLEIAEAYLAPDLEIVRSYSGTCWYLGTC